MFARARLVPLAAVLWLNLVAPVRADDQQSTSVDYAAAVLADRPAAYWRLNNVAGPLNLEFDRDFGFDRVTGRATRRFHVTDRVAPEDQRAEDGRDGHANECFFHDKHD